MDSWKINDFDESSKVWVYTLEPKLTGSQENEINEALTAFCLNWTAHQKELRAFFKIIDRSILVLGVDEHLNPASGCSIDKSVHFLESLEEKYNISVFNRMVFNYVNNENQIVSCNKNRFEELIQNNTITSETLVINTLATTLNVWNKTGVQKLKDSWMYNFLGINV